MLSAGRRARLNELMLLPYKLMQHEVPGRQSEASGDRRLGKNSLRSPAQSIELLSHFT
jgi:hypothetical protein